MENKEFVWFDDRGVLEYIQSEEGKRNLLPAVSIAISPKCNLACPHCIYDAGKENPDGLTTDEKVSLLEQSAEQGARFLQICHDGEPMEDPSTFPILEKTRERRMESFMYDNGSRITPEIAQRLYATGVRLGIKFDSLNPKIFNKMIDKPEAHNIYQGLENLLEAGYRNPERKDGRLVTRLGLVTTLTSLNTGNIDEVKDIARYAWKNNIFFGIARLEQGGRATGKVWETFKIPDKDKIIRLVDWCSEQTGVDYWNAQPTPYCIGVCGLQISDNGNVWMTTYGGSCDFTEPDGESFPEKVITIGNTRKTSLKEIVQRVWGFRQAVFHNGILDKKLADYEATKDLYPNGLQDCGSARTHTLFVPFYNYVKEVIEGVL